MSEDLAVFFDLGDTLAAPAMEAGHLRLEVFPFVPEVLTRLRAAGGGARVRLGLMSNTGDLGAATLEAALDEAGLRPLVEPALCLFSSVEGIDKSDPAFFARGIDRAGLPAGACVFVGESEQERRVAESAGLVTSPHPLHAVHLVERRLAGGSPA